MKYAKTAPAIQASTPAFDSSAVCFEAFRIGWYLILWAAVEHLSGPLLTEAIRRTAIIWAPACVLSLILLRRGRPGLYAAIGRGSVSWLVLTTYMTDGDVSFSTGTAYTAFWCGLVSFALLLIAFFCRDKPQKPCSTIQAATVASKDASPVATDKGGWVPTNRPPASPEELAMRVAAVTGRPATRQSKNATATIPDALPTPTRGIAQLPGMKKHEDAAPVQHSLFDFPAELSEAPYDKYLEVISRTGI